MDRKYNSVWEFFAECESDSGEALPECKERDMEYEEMKMKNRKRKKK